MLRHLILAGAVALSATAAAQPPATAPVPPPVGADPMNPAAPPRNMEGHEDAGNLSTRDQLERLKRMMGIEERKRSDAPRGSAAAAADLVAGATVRDSRGSVVGTIEMAEADGAVVATGAGKVKVPLEAFGKNRKGLLLGITKSDFDAAVAAAVAAPAS